MGGVTEGTCAPGALLFADEDLHRREIVGKFGCRNVSSVICVAVHLRDETAFEAIQISNP